MPDEAREMQTIRPASHTTALGGLFIADVWAGVQGGVYGVGYRIGTRRRWRVRPETTLPAAITIQASVGQQPVLRDEDQA
jgi:hypothetical protein